VTLTTTSPAVVMCPELESTSDLTDHESALACSVVFGGVWLRRFTGPSGDSQPPTSGQNKKAPERQAKDKPL
jgi:hypothetical protein